MKPYEIIEEKLIKKAQNKKKKKMKVSGTSTKKIIEIIKAKSKKK